jgi:hypothetical protein
MDTVQKQVILGEIYYRQTYFEFIIRHPFKDEAQTALFKDPVRTAQ